MRKITIHSLGMSFLLFLSILIGKLMYFNTQIGVQSIGYVHVIAALGSLLLMAAIGLVMKPKTACWYMGILDLIISLLIFSDVMFYRYFNDMVSVPLLAQAGNLGDVQSSMLQLLHWSDLLFAVDFILLPLLFRTDMFKLKSEKKNFNRFIKAAAAFASGSLIVFLSFSSLVRSQPTILQNFYDRVYVAQNIGVLNYHAADAYRFVMQSIGDQEQLSEEKQQQIIEYFKQENLPAQAGDFLHGAGKDKNLIVIQVEALQQFVINRSLNGQEITPNLNRLAASGIYFDNYYFQTAGGGTSDAEFTSNVSMFPMKEGAVYIRKPGNNYFSLPQKMKENGYTTIAMHGYKPGFWNRTMVYKNIGFDEFISKSNMEAAEQLGMGVSDKAFLKHAIDELSTANQPYFAFLITLSSHFPYDNDKSKYSSFEVGKYGGTLLGNYIESVHYADEALGEFVNALSQNNMLDHTVLAIYGDHHGIPRDSSNELAAFLDQGNLSSLEWQKLQKVPMLISLPGLEKGMTISTVGGGVDFMPTLLNIMGIEAKTIPMFGRDLLNSKEGFVVLRNGSFVTNELLYISSENKCYDVDTGEILPIEQVQEQKQEADKLLDYSDTILKYDLVDEIHRELNKK